MKPESGKRMARSGKGRATGTAWCLLSVAWCLLLACCLLPVSALAQIPTDTVLRIRPEQRAPDSASRATLPPSIVDEVLTAYERR